MRGRLWVVWGFFALIACTKPAGPRALVEFDAGTQIRRSIDVRTALLFAYPEYRGTEVLDASARVTRHIPGLSREARDLSLANLKYAVSDSGSGWDLSSFHLEQLAHDTLEVSVSLKADDVGRLMLAPTGLSSMDMAQYLPRQLPVGHETFEFELRYRATPARCLQLVRQAVMLLQGNQQWNVSRAPPQWNADAQTDEDSPENFVVEVTGIVDGARISWDRSRGQVRVRYVLETVSRGT